MSQIATSNSYTVGFCGLGSPDLVRPFDISTGVGVTGVVCHARATGFIPRGRGGRGPVGLTGFVGARRTTVDDRFAMDIARVNAGQYPAGWERLGPHGNHRGNRW